MWQGLGEGKEIDFFKCRCRNVEKVKETVSYLPVHAKKRKARHFLKEVGILW